MIAHTYTKPHRDALAYIIGELKAKAFPWFAGQQEHLPLVRRCILATPWES